MTNYLHDAVINEELTIINSELAKSINISANDAMVTNFFLRAIVNLLILMVRMFLEYSRRR